MANMTYVSPENLKAILLEVISNLEDATSTEIKEELSKIIDGADYDTLKKVSEYISTHKEEYDALMALVGDKANATDLSKLQGIVESLQKQIQGSSHSHDNKGILDATTASFTTEEKTKLKNIVDGANKTVVDTALNESSENPVQNKAVYAKFEEQSGEINELRSDIDNIGESLQPMTPEAVSGMLSDIFKN